MNKIGIRPFRKNDAMLIKDWCKDERLFINGRQAGLGNILLLLKDCLGNCMAGMIMMGIFRLLLLMKTDLQAFYFEKTLAAQCMNCVSASSL